MYPKDFGGAPRSLAPGLLLYNLVTRSKCKKGLCVSYVLCLSYASVSKSEFLAAGTFLHKNIASIDLVGRGLPRIHFSKI